MLYPFFFNIDTTDLRMRWKHLEYSTMGVGFGETLAAMQERFRERKREGKD